MGFFYPFELVEGGGQQMRSRRGVGAAKSTQVPGAQSLSERRPNMIIEPCP